MLARSPVTGKCVRSRDYPVAGDGANMDNERYCPSPLTPHIFVASSTPPLVVSRSMAAASSTRWRSFSA